MNSNDSIQKDAIQNLDFLRRTIERAGNRSMIPGNLNAIEAGLFLQSVCGVLATSLIVFEIASGREMSSIMMISATDKEIGLLGLAQVAITLPAVLMCIYFIAWRAAHRQGDELNSYLSRNFQYLSRLSFASDLTMKFVPMSLLVIAGHAEWIPSLLSLFIGDYLIQGRFFSIPTRTSILLGCLSIVAAVAQYLAHSTDLIWPMIHFTVVTALSLVFLMREQKNVKESLKGV